MSSRFAKNPVVLIGKQVDISTQLKTPTSKHADSLVITKVTNAVDIPMKTGTKEPKANNTQAGYTHAEAVLTGAWTAEHNWLFEAYTGDASSPHTLGSNDIPYYSLYNYFEDGATDHYDVGIGMKCINLTFDSSGDGAVMFTANFKGASRLMEVADSTTAALTLSSLSDSDATMPADTPMLATDSTCEIEGTTAKIVNMISGNLNLTNVPQDDAANFQNSDVMSSFYICEHTGEQSFSWVYETTDDPNIYDNLVGTVQKDTMVFTDGSATHTFVTYGKVLTYNRPDPGKCKFISDLTKRLGGDSSNAALTITVA